MSNFTKGEWLVEQCDLPITESEYFNIKAVSGGCIAETYNEHDANLMSAAPDMYNHIQQDIEILQRECKNHVLGSYQLIHLLLRIKSKKALLSKARGES